MFRAGYPVQYIAKTNSVLDKALQISGYKGEFILRYKEVIEDDTFALTKWSILNLYRVPIITVCKELLDSDYDTVGFTLAHEFVHCRQGFWKVFFGSFGIIDVENEAYDMINRWYS